MRELIEAIEEHVMSISSIHDLPELTNAPKNTQSKERRLLVLIDTKAEKIVEASRIKRHAVTLKEQQDMLERHPEWRHTLVANIDAIETEIAYVKGIILTNFILNLTHSI